MKSFLSGREVPGGEEHFPVRSERRLCEQVWVQEAAVFGFTAAGQTAKWNILKTISSWELDCSPTFVHNLWVALHFCDTRAPVHSQHRKWHLKYRQALDGILWVLSLKGFRDSYLKLGENTRGPFIHFLSQTMWFFYKEFKFQTMLLYYDRYLCPIGMFYWKYYIFTFCNFSNSCSLERKCHFISSFFIVYTCNFSFWKM